jgi:hypothetical protein
MIFYPLVLAALIGLAVADEGQAGIGGGLLGGRLQGLAEPRLAVNAIRIHQLEKHIGKLKARIEEASHVDPSRFADELDARLSAIEGNHCEKKEFQCGSSGQECISDLFICDGHKDCHNGHDEDEEVCSTAPVKPGNVFTGLLHWKDCILREDHLTHLTITGTKRMKFFPARVGVQAVINSVYTDKEGEHSRKFNLKGGYNFANRRLVLFPSGEEKGYNLGVKCEFNHGDNERADCTLLTEASLHECAVAHLALEHHDEHH